MKLFRGYLQNKFLELVNNDVKVVFLGDTTPIAPDIISQMRKLEKLNVKWINRFNQLNKNTNLFICNEFIDSFPIF